MTIMHNRQRCIEAEKISISSLDSNPQTPLREAPDDFIRQIEETARELGVDRIGFTTVPGHLVFPEKEILYEDVIMVAQDMDHSRITTSPSMEAGQATFETYANLGEIANDLADHLRRPVTEPRTACPWEASASTRSWPSRRGWECGAATAS